METLQNLVKNGADKYHQKLFWVQQQLPLVVATLKAMGEAAVWTVALLWTALPCFYLALGLWIKNKVVKKETDQMLPQNERKKILMTGGLTTKALHLARVMGRKGHTVIMADQNPWVKLSIGNCSNFISKFVLVEGFKTPDEYAQKLAHIGIEERVDWFLPVSSADLAGPDAKAKTLMEQNGVQGFTGLAVSSQALANQMSDHLAFMLESRELGLSVPEFRPLQDVAQDLTNFFDEGLFGDRYFYLKPTITNNNEVVVKKRIPADKAGFEAYLKTVVPALDRKYTYFMVEKIEGNPYTASVIAKDGKLVVFQVCPDSDMNFVTVDNSDIQKWAETFCRLKNLTGMVNFDFIIDESSAEAVSIQANPRLHSGIVCFNSGDQMTHLEEILRKAMNGDDISAVQPLMCTGSTPTYWLYNELGAMVKGQKTWRDVRDVIKAGRDPTWSYNDPVPFVVLNAVQMPVELIKSMVTGRIWRRVDFCLGQVV